MDITCPICKSNKIRFLKKNQGVSIFECTNCETAIIPKNIKDNNVYDFKSYNERKKYFKKRFNKLINKITNFKKTGEALDIGGGYGLFAHLLEERGFVVEIIEPYLKVKYTKKNKVYRTTFENFITKQKKKYDLILLMDVLEHFKKPDVVLLQIKKILKNNGIVVIQTPNYKSLMARITTNWAWWMVEDHKLIFSKNSLNKLLQKTGYKILYTKTYEDLMDFKKNLDGNFVPIKNIYKRRFIKLFFYILFLPTYMITRNLFWYMGYGGLIFTISKKQ